MLFVESTAVSNNGFFSNALIWPIVVIILAIIFRSTLQDLIKRFKKGKAFGAEIELENEVQKQQNSNVRELTNIEKATAIFHGETINYFRGLVISESEYEKMTSDAQKTETLIKYATIIYIKSNFDYLYEDVFGSQLKLLLHLNTVPHTGETYEGLKLFYDEAVEQYGKRYDGYSYENYFNFLIRKGLVVAKGDRYVITIGAQDLIKYIVATNKTYNKIF